MPYSTTSWSMMMMMGSRVSSSSGVIITHMHMQREREIIVRVSVEKSKVFFFYILFFPFLGPFVCNYVVFFIIIITLRVFVIYSLFFKQQQNRIAEFFIFILSFKMKEKWKSSGRRREPVETNGNIVFSSATNILIMVVVWLNEGVFSRRDVVLLLCQWGNKRNREGEGGRRGNICVGSGLIKEIGQNNSQICTYIHRLVFPLCWAPFLDTLELYGPGQLGGSRLLLLSFFSLSLLYTCK
jgi:hypothetical protein